MREMRLVPGLGEVWKSGKTFGEKLKDIYTVEEIEIS
jgi:hypothetical protein